MELLIWLNFDMVGFLNMAIIFGGEKVQLFFYFLPNGEMVQFLFSFGHIFIDDDMVK